MHNQIIIVGGGSAGISVASRLIKADRTLDIAIIEPSSKHYYQPLWTLVGGGVVDASSTEKDEKKLIPKGVKLIQDSVIGMDPAENRITTAKGETITYNYAVICPGIQLDWHKIKGLPETLGKNGVCSNYRYDQAPYTWKVIDALKGGKAIFTQPSTPIKCGGAPQKIMYLTADQLRKRDLLDQTDVQFMSPGAVVFGVKEFETTLKKVIARYGIKFNLKHELVEIRGESREAVFRVTPEDGEPFDRIEKFDMLHVVPPQSAPDFIKDSALANEAGWVDVHPNTLQHNRFPNVFSLGDVAGTPNAKTGAAVRKQAPTVTGNLLQLIRSGAILKPKEYFGYSSCPLITGYGKLVLAEFDYENKPQPTFPFDQTKERRSMYLMKRFLLPVLYWKGMLRGRA